jgi:hypothetical protein
LFFLLTLTHFSSQLKALYQDLDLDEEIEKPHQEFSEGKSDENETETEKTEKTEPTPSSELQTPEVENAPASEESESQKEKPKLRLDEIPLLNEEELMEHSIPELKKEISKLNEKLKGIFFCECVRVCVSMCA